MGFYLALFGFLLMVVTTNALNGWMSLYIDVRQCDKPIVKLDTYFVNCSNRKIVTFPKFADETEILDLSRNNLHELSIEFLYYDNHNKLKHLNLSLNLIDYISDSFFMKFPSLETLDLSGNRLQRLSDIGNVNFLNNLKELFLQNNSIKKIDSSSIDRILLNKSIYKLDLSKCEIKQIEVHAFEFMSNLTYLYLSENPLTNLNQINSNTLEHLEVSNCDLNDIWDGNHIEKLPKLKYLDVSRNKYLGNQTFDQYRFSHNLLSLDASDCDLNDDSILNEFPNLRFVKLNNNKIHNLYHNTFYTNVISLDLSSNFIYTINAKTFRNFFHLKKLNISHNPLKTINSLRLEYLDSLDISYCDIHDLNTDFIRVMIYVPNLKVLNLSNNPLEYFSNEINLFYLEDIDLSYCRLVKIARSDFEKLYSLKRLDLRGNRLTDIFIFSMPISFELILIDNPWQCHCGSREIFYVLNQHYRPTVDQSKLSCFIDNRLVLWNDTTLCFDNYTKVAGEYNFKKIRDSSVLLFILIMILYLRKYTCSNNRENDNDIAAETTATGSQTPSPVLSPIQDVHVLPTYEEVILLPKPAEDILPKNTRDVSTWTSNQNINIESVDGN